MQRYPSNNLNRGLGIVATLIFLTIVLGGVVQVSGIQFACSGWPSCDGSWLPPMGSPQIFDYGHRSFGFLAFVGMLFLVPVAYTQQRRMDLYLLISVIGLTLIQAVIGIYGIGDSAGWVTASHLALSMLALALILVALVNGQSSITIDLANSINTRYKRLVAFNGLFLFLVFVSGSLVTSFDAGPSCASWPMCQPLIPINASGWVHLIHRIVVGLSAISALWVLIKGWRVLRNETGSLVAATLVAMLFLAQIQLGALQVLRGFPTDLLWLHQAASAALWAAWVVLFALQLVSNRSQAEENNAAASPLDFGARIKDLVILSKPIIVLLLLVTTYTGMVVAGKTIPGLSITFWTMLGGALAAGGSGAVNQYIDREVDQRMTRTANRPIAAGRMTPAEGIAFGVGVLVVAFLILAGFVNLLSALLSLVGMLYYVVLYSLWLKHRSVQNIVIGGGAGAIPPLVGWAAVTGTLSLPAFFLFAIIFMWTPPHFWALALIRKNDYERAGIPMLPVIKGREETQRQVWIYTLELVALTLAMWVFQFAGLIYLVSALLLGGYLIYWAWRVFKDGSNKIAWSMYRYSSMYLALLFVALMIDAVLS